MKYILDVFLFSMGYSGETRKGKLTIMKAIDKDALSYSLQSDSLMDHRIVFSKEKKDTKPKNSEIASCQVNAFRA